MSDSIDAPPTPRSFTIAVLVVILVAAINGARAQAPSPSPPIKSVIIQVAPTPAPEPAPAPAPAPDQATPVVPVPPAASAPAEAAPETRENPGLINELGKLFKAPTWTLPAIPSLPALPSLNNLGQSGDGLPQLTTVVKGRMVCPVAANGAPDCKAASDKLCQGKGFKEGKSLDTDSAQSCSRKSFMTGNKADDVCKTENYVTRALCQ
jgi:hypothetical protein